MLTKGKNEDKNEWGVFKEKNKKRWLGKNNPRWNGGISEYPNHAEMKRNRIIKLTKSKNKCEICGGEAYCIHHLDGSKDNHSLDNLVVICRKCHLVLHNDRSNNPPKTSKFIREYGMTIRAISEKYGGSQSYYYGIHREGKLKDFLKNIKPEINLPKSKL